MRTDLARYVSGEEILIVFVIDDGSYSDEFPEGQWSHLGSGFMIEVESKVAGRDWELFNLGLPHDHLLSPRRLEVSDDGH